MGVAIEGVRDAHAFTQLHAFAGARGHSLFYGGGDAENTPDEDLVGLYPWVLGTEVVYVEGGDEQAQGFAYTPGGELDARRAALRGELGAVRAFCQTRAMRLASGAGVFLVARGGLPLALLMNGEWQRAPDELALREDDDALGAWLATHTEPLACPSTGVVGFGHGTRGATQAPLPAVVHGICIAGADATCAPVHLSAARDAELDIRLWEAGIEAPRYFLMTRYD